MEIFPVVLALFVPSVLTIVMVTVMMFGRNDYCSWMMMAMMMPVMKWRDPDTYAYMDLACACCIQLRKPYDS
jgi:hypothetical protein